MVKEKIKCVIRLRKKSGYIRQNVVEAYRLWSDERSLYAGFALLHCVMTFCFGTKIANVTVSRAAYQLRILPHQVSAAKKLYHWTPAENMDRILKEGLTDQQEHRIFLTDRAEFMANTGFLEWKQEQIGKKCEFALIEVDPGSPGGPKTMMTKGFRMHEFTVESVPPSCITGYKTGFHHVQGGCQKLRPGSGVT